MRVCMYVCVRERGGERGREEGRERESTATDRIEILINSDGIRIIEAMRKRYYQYITCSQINMFFIPKLVVVSCKNNFHHTILE